jgi:hypothetical protein
VAWACGREGRGGVPDVLWHVGLEAPSRQWRRGAQACSASGWDMMHAAENIAGVLAAGPAWGDGRRAGPKKNSASFDLLEFFLKRLKLIRSNDVLSVLKKFE